MARSVWSVQSAKNEFSALVEAAGREPQTVTKHGRPAVVVIAVDEFERLQKLERVKAPRFNEHLLAMPRDDGEFPRMTGKLRDDT